MAVTAKQEASVAEPPLLADHLALDLVNTQARSDGALVEFFNTGDDVLRWLARQAIVPAAGQQFDQVDQAALLAQALALRALATQLVAAHKAGEALQPAQAAALNAWLAANPSIVQLAPDGEGRWTLARRRRGEAVAALLGPVAEALAQLLAEGDFGLVKQCEHPECILWFYDRTKAHKRRWCSMALCGNRHKAAQFRRRAGEQSA